MPDTLTGDITVREVHLWWDPDDGHATLSVATPLGDGHTALRLTGPAAVYLRRVTSRNTVGGQVDDVTLTVRFRGATPPQDHGPRHLLRPSTPAPA